MPDFESWLRKHSVPLLLSLIVLFGLLLRVWMLGNTPMWVDETISGLVAEGILHHGLPVLSSGMVYWRALLYHYTEAGFLLLFGVSDGVARLPSVLFGMCTIVLAYFIGREFGLGDEDESGKNHVTGLVAALLCCVLYLEVLYSRQARFYQLFQLLFFLSLYLLYKSSFRGWGAKRSAWLACLTLVLCVQTHIAGLVLVPFYLIVFWMRFDWKKDGNWRLFVVPVLVGAYYGLSFLGIGFSLGSGGGGLASVYAENYSSAIYDYLAGFLLLALVGTGFAYNSNKRLCLLILLPSGLLFVGLFFIKVFALRYAYFVVLALVLMIANLFGYLYKHSKWLFVLALVFAIVYPSNLVFSANYFTVVLPSDVHTTSMSEPIIDYKNLNESTRELILGSKIVVLSTPGVEWYLKRPDYFMPFSLNGLKIGYALYNGADAYTGARVYNGEVFESGFVLLEDAFGWSKIDAESRVLLNDTEKDCLLLQQTYGLNVYSCN